jgi:hypothetical protein
MEIDLSDQHSGKALASSSRKMDCGSNITEDKVEQFPKHPDPILSTEFGMEIDLREKEFAKTSASSSRKIDCGSNMTEERAPHWEKHPV